jgi:hypothetical protein
MPAGLGWCPRAHGSDSRMEGRLLMADGPSVTGPTPRDVPMSAVPKGLCDHIDELNAGHAGTVCLRFDSGGPGGTAGNPDRKTKPGAQSTDQSAAFPRTGLASGVRPGSTAGGTAGGTGFPVGSIGSGESAPVRGAECRSTTRRLTRTRPDHASRRSTGWCFHR